MIPAALTSEEMAPQAGSRKRAARASRVTSNKIETVTGLLEQRILAREWDVNQSLPSQGHLSREYGVSLGTVALALRNLQQKRLINIVSNKGAFVLEEPKAGAPGRVYPLIGLRGSYVGSAGGNGGALVGGIVDVANAEHCPLLLLPRSPDGKDYDASYYRARGVQGAIFLGGESYAEALQLRASGFPVILANEPVRGTPLNYINYDHRESLRKITNLFLDHGHEKIAVLFSQTSIPSYFDSMLPEFLSTLALRGNLYPDVRDYWRCIDMTEPGKGEETVRELFALPEPPTAVFALAPSIAALAVTAARKIGMSVPEDLSIAGSCFIHEADTMISGFVLPHRPLGESLLHEMYATIENPFHCVQKLLPLSFVDRQTITPRKSSRKTSRR